MSFWLPLAPFFVFVGDAFDVFSGLGQNGGPEVVLGGLFGFALVREPYSYLENT